MPNALRVDTTPPASRLRESRRACSSPARRLKVRYLLNEPARVYVFLDGKRVVLGRSTRLKWKVEWPSQGGQAVPRDRRGARRRREPVGRSRAVSSSSRCAC